MFPQSQEIFEILFDGVSEGIIVVNKKQEIVAVNSSAEKMFGYENGELEQQPLNILIPQKFHPHHDSHFNGFMQKSESRKMGQEKDLFGRTKNNQEIPIEVGLNPFEIYGMELVMAIVIDISDRKNNEKKIENLNSQLEKKIKDRTLELNNTIEKLKKLNLEYENEIKKRLAAEKKIKVALKKEIELNDLKTKFLSLVSHEFKTPLSGILTSTILLEKYQLSEQQPKRDKHLKTITTKVHYLNNILNDFLSLERLDSDKVNYKCTAFNLSKVINEVVYNANMHLKSGQRINIPENTDEYVLFQDEKILELSLTNLINNAIKYSPENTKIDLYVEQNDKNLIFKVRDRGIGIPKNDQKYIFNRYFRAENALNNQGTGIGLNIVKVHLENLGGTISFTSEINQGSEFTIELPIKKE